MCTWFCLHPPRVCFLWKFCNQIPLTCKVKFPGASQSLSQVGKSGVGPRTFETVRELLGAIVLQFVDCLLGGSMVGLMASSFKRTYATCHASQVCYSQRPCTHSRSLLPHDSARDTQTLKGRSGSVSCGVPGSWCTQDFV